jgi:hypothetical protein
MRDASVETGIPKECFPECPFTFEQLMDPDFFPEDVA